MPTPPPRRNLALLAPLALAWWTAAARASNTVEEATLFPADGSADFGHAVGVWADTAIVGATGDGDLGILAGAAYVYLRGPGGWAQEAKLHASDGGIAQRFGWSVAIEGDLAAVGALFADGVHASTSGAVYIYTRTAGSWSEQQKLSGTATSDWFSRAIALWGDTLVVGAPQEDTLAADAGAVHVYQRAGGVFNEIALLTASDGAAGDGFGEAVAIAGDRIVVGAPHDDDNGGSSGAIYVFDRVGGGFLETVKLTPLGGTSGAWFGKAVATNGSRVAGGAYRADRLTPPRLFDVGAAYVFSDAGGAWLEEGTLFASDASAGDEFGWSLAFAGGELFVGADQASGTGAVYRFADQGGGWTEIEKVVASDASSGAAYGWSLARDGATVLAGATGATSPAGTTGACYVLAIVQPFTPYCFGDGSGAVCPCGNQGGPGEGCANSTGAGATLAAAGSASVTADDLVLAAAGLLPNQPALLFAGQNTTGGGLGVPFGDGLRCAGGGVRRLGVRVPDATGGAGWGPGLGAQGGWTAGDVRRFQAWYRDPQGSPCGTGFNLSSAVEVTLEP